MSEPKHSGCYDCGSREQEFLVGHAPPGVKFTLALCDQCRAERQQKQTEHKKEAR